MTEALVAVRFVHFVACMAAFGIGAFRLYAFAGAPATATASAAFVELETRLCQLTTAAAALALLTALAMVPCVTAEMTGSADAGFALTMSGTMLTETEFGHAWCWHIGFTGALLVACLLANGRWQAPLVSGTALLALASLGWVGHAAMDMGGGPTHAINQMLHLTAAGAWLGGLLPLGMLLRRALRAGDEGHAALARVALPHFSQMGYAALALLIVTGTVNSMMLVGSFHGLTASAYGRLLMVKIALFAALLALALINRLYLMPRLRRRPPSVEPLRALCRSVLAEQALGLAVLAVVAALGTWPPPMDGMVM